MSSDAMRGGAIWPTMSSTCIQNSAVPHHVTFGGGSRFQPHALVESHLPAPTWNHNPIHHAIFNNNTMKQEPMEQETPDPSYAVSYLHTDEGFHSSSPSRTSEQNSPDLSHVMLTSSPQSDSGEVDSIYCNSTTYGVNNNISTTIKSPQVSSDDKQKYPAFLKEEVCTPSRKSPHSSNYSEAGDSEENYGRSDEEGCSQNLQIRYEKNELNGPLTPPNNTHSDLEQAGKDANKPSFNSHGKLKIYKCKQKQCDFVATSKQDFWEHRSIHIPVGKLMKCDKCPFVTEYKHHFEYHLRKHDGSKPFRCTRCDYSCVNKSMLTSHMKSHSTVYQFNCADCNYATKYLHSLKMHLRKYTHKPAMVLNEDGSPSQWPLVDVYGTRRGPRQRPHRTTQSGTIQELDQPMDITPNHNQSPSPDLNRLPMQYNAAMPFFPMIPDNSHLGYNPMSDPMAAQSLLEHPSRIQPNPLVLFSLLNAFPEQVRNKLMSQIMNPEIKMEQSATENANETKMECHVCDFTTYNEDNLRTHFDQEHREPIIDVKVLNEEKTDDGKDLSALDLTNKSDLIRVPEYESTNKNISLNIPEIRVEKTSIFKEKKSRRKGRAFKLDTSEQHSSVDNCQRTSSVIEHTEDVRKHVSTDNEVINKSSPAKKTPTKENPHTKEETFTCEYCEISFKFIEMYKVHMGYHGYQDPYTCNMCGLQCSDKMAFYTHTLHERHC